MGRKGWGNSIRLLAGAALLLPLSLAAARACPPLDGPYVVINVPSDDPIGGLAIRSEPSSRAQRIGLIPPDGVGIHVARCEDSGWCEVRYACSAGWSYLAKYLAPRRKRLTRVYDVAPYDTLNVRAGPGARFEKIGEFAYDTVGLVRHACEPSRTDPAVRWCLVSAPRLSGWVSSAFLADEEEQAAPAPPPMPGPGPSPTSAPDPRDATPRPPPGMSSRGCQIYPDLC